jgi:superoxide dismutase, Fe-Mn family
MKKVLRKLPVLLMSGFVLLLLACQSAPQVGASPSTTMAQKPTASLSAAPAQLAPLPYDYAALEPYIDAQTMRIHHDKHHATYVTNLNDALKDTPELQKLGVEGILKDLNKVPENIRTKVRNNGGGHLNHTMFWEIMGPKAGGAPTGKLAEAINQTFGSFDKFKTEFEKAGTGRFGSGWAWLVRDGKGQLKVTSTPNQDNPIMEDPNSYPILGNDVWEHAYYLKYQNKRADYLKNWWNVVNWKAVSQRYDRAIANK